MARLWLQRSVPFFKNCYLVKSHFNSLITVGGGEKCSLVAKHFAYDVVSFCYLIEWQPLVADVELAKLGECIHWNMTEVDLPTNYL